MNKAHYHLVIVPEDPIYHDFANGFRRALPQWLQRQVKVEQPGKGWCSTLDFAEQLASENMDKRMILALIDFDVKTSPSDDATDKKLIESRKEEVSKRIGEKKNFTVLGPFQEAENLKAEIKASSALHLANGSAIVHNVDCGALFAHDGFACEKELWSLRQLDNDINSQMLPVLCEFLQRKLAAEASGARV